MEPIKINVEEVIAPFESIFPEFFVWFKESSASGDLNRLFDVLFNNEEIGRVLQHLFIDYRGVELLALSLGYYLGETEDCGGLSKQSPPVSILH
jgi:hypothetical protein